MSEWGKDYVGIVFEKELGGIWNIVCQVRFIMYMDVCRCWFIIWGRIVFFFFGRREVRV